MDSERFSRRDWFRIAGISSVSLILSACLPKRILNGESDLAALDNLISPDLEISLKAIPDKIQLLPGKKTSIWRYVGEVLKGPEDTLLDIPGSYLGPIIQAKRGERIRVHFRNDLPEPSIIHWHGLHVPPAADGHPRLVIDPGDTYIYDFLVDDRAGTYWYHPHPHGRTGPQVYRGLAGLFLIRDEEELDAELPGGEFEIPLVIQDKDFNQENQLVYDTGHMMDRMVGFLGSKVLINGMPEHEFSVSRHPYRLRLLNGSNSRIYKLAWDDSAPLVVIGTDGGLLEKPVEKDYVTLAPAQRIEIWADFSQDQLGSTKSLISLPFDGFGGQAPFLVTRMNVEREAGDTPVLKERLTKLESHNLEEAVNRNSPRSFQLNLAPGMIWTINGRTFEMEDVASDEIVRLNDLEIWEFENRIGMGMGMMGGMSVPHPIHLHGLQFQILERKVSISTRDGWNTLSAGFVDEGWHDTVLVYPGEKVKILVKFEDFSGLYLYHCHNLEHEDMGMMRNYRVDPA